MNYIERIFIPNRPTKVLWNCIFELKAGQFQEYDAVWFHRSSETSVVQKTFHMDLTKGRTR